MSFLVLYKDSASPVLRLPCTGSDSWTAVPRHQYRFATKLEARLFLRRFYHRNNVHFERYPENKQYYTIKETP